MNTRLIASLLAASSASVLIAAQSLPATARTLPRVEAPQITATVQSGEYGDLGRITFETTEDVPGQAIKGDQSIMVHFLRPVSANVAGIAARMPRYVTGVEKVGDDYVIHTAPGVALHAFTEDRKLVLDFSGARGARRPTSSEELNASEAAALAATPTRQSAPIKPVDVKAPEVKTTDVKTAEAKVADTTPAAAEGQTAPGAEPVGNLLVKIGDGFGLDRILLSDYSKTLTATMKRSGTDVQIAFNRPLQAPDHLMHSLPSTVRRPLMEQRPGSSILHLSVGANARTFLDREGKWWVLSVYQTPLRKPGSAAGVAVAAAPDTEAQPAPEPAPAPAPPPVPVAVAPPPPSTAGDAIARPGAPLVARFVPGPEGGSLRFDWARPVSAALFRRGDKLWIVFDAPIAVNLDAVRSAFPRAEQLPSGDATVVRVPLAATLNPSPRRAGNSWIVDLRTQPMRAEAPVELHIVDRGGKRVQFSALEAAPPVSITDPDAGDRVIAVPLASLGQGMGQSRHFVEFDALSSAQGLAFLPIADGLDVRSLPQMVDVSIPGGLTISSDNERQARLSAPSTPSRFALAVWRGDAGTPYAERRQAKLAAVAAASPAERSTARMALVRFYFANGFATEALGLLNAIREDDAAAVTSPGVRAIRGACLAYTGDTAAAWRDLSIPELADDPDAALWRGSAFATDKDWAKAAPEFARGLGVIDPYPPSMRHRLLLQAARTALGKGDEAAAEERAQTVRNDDPTSPERQEAEYIMGLAAQAKGNMAEAVEHWTAASGGENGPNQVRASLARTLALVQMGKMQRTDAIAALEKLRYSWRGDNFELELLRQLGQLQVDDGDVRTGLITWRSAVSSFPDRPEAKQLAADMSAAFTSVFVGDKAANVSPLKAVALYDEFRELTPNGPVGDQVIRNLADRLVKVDLLDRAGNLLDYQTKYRLTGKDRVRVATQLALVRLLDHKPDAAIAALDLDAVKDVPPDLTRQRQELRGRALLEQGKPAEALAILSGDTSEDGDRLRADIYWKTQNWPEVAKLLPKLIGPVKDDKLAGTASRTVLSLATALVLGNDQAGLTQLRNQYGAAMEKGPDRQAFRVVAGNPDGLPTDYHALAGVVAQTGDFTGFLASYKQKLGSESLSAIN